MSGSALHRVHRLRWQASAPTTADAFALRQLLRDRGEAVHAAIEQACAAALRQGADADTVWQVPRLVLRIQAADVARLDADLPGQVAMALRDALSDAGIGALAPLAGQAKGMAEAAPASPSSPQWPATADRPLDVNPQARASSPAAHAQASLRHYLHTGGLDWALAGRADDASQAALRSAALQAVQALLRGTRVLDDLLPLPAGAVEARAGALLRWLQLLPTAWRLQWLAASPAPAGISRALQRGWLQGLGDAPPHDALPWMALWLAWGALPSAATVSPKADTFDAAPALRAWAVAHLAGAPPKPSAGAGWLPALLKALGQPPAATPSPVRVASGVPPIAEPTHDADTQPALLVPLAGLVLLHPYLPRFLAGCGVLAPCGRAIAAGELPRACALLHALACGDGEAFEHQLPLVKLLLGRAPDEPLSAALPRLAPADGDEVDALLAAVRAHWAALRGTGIDGLRLSFLQRRGLLRRTDGAWQLHVQAEPFDLLLGLRPWGISLVKLPWMEQPLMVAWP